jgi:hypothetical protein
MKFAHRIYSCFLLAYPARLRRDFGPEMTQLFLDQLAGAKARRRTARFYLRTLTDWFQSVPAAHHAEHRLRQAEPHAFTPTHRLLRRGLVFAPNPAIALCITAGVLAWQYVRKLNSRPPTI